MIYILGCLIKCARLCHLTVEEVQLGGQFYVIVTSIGAPGLMYILIRKLHGTHGVILLVKIRGAIQYGSIATLTLSMYTEWYPE